MTAAPGTGVVDRPAPTHCPRCRHVYSLTHQTIALPKGVPLEEDSVLTLFAKPFRRCTETTNGIACQCTWSIEGRGPTLDPLEYPQPLRLEIGPGNQPRDGWTHVDVQSKRPTVDIVADARDIPLPSGSVLEVFASHVFEHFGWRESGFVLDEWRRVLAPGGRIEIHVPDLDVACEAWLEGRYEMALPPFYGDQKDDDDYHYAGFNWNLLSALLKAHGFVEIARIRPESHHDYYGNLAVIGSVPKE